MSDADEKLRLNTLHRFAKHSDRLVLMEYTHCEVPAGCGGYIMRWRDPQAGLPLVLSIACPGQLQAFVDGALVTTSHVSLPTGQHLLAIQATLDKPPAPLAVAVCVDDPRTAPGEEVLASAADGTWRFTTSRPEDTWVASGYDDAGWKPLPRWESQQELDTPLRWRFERLIERGAEPLRIERREIWIRKRVTIREPSQ